jgi:hypothetical protein
MGGEQHATTLEADLAVTPLLGHSIPESLEIIAHTGDCQDCRRFKSTSMKSGIRAT